MMKFKMNRVPLVLLIALGLVCTAAQAGDIVWWLDDANARVDYTEPRAGAIGDTTDVREAITLAARFNPDPDADMSGGPVIVAEIGGTTNGTGIYLGDGNLIFVSKNAAGGAVPTGMDDTDFSDGALAIDLGPVLPGVENEVFVSFAAITGELIASINGQLQTLAIANSTGSENLSGNNSISFLGSGGINIGHMGGLVGSDTWPLVYDSNTRNMAQTPGYADQRGQVFAEAVVLDVLPPYSPSPANAAENVDPDAVTALAFFTAADPADPGSANPAVTGHWLRANFNDPNFIDTMPDWQSAFIPAGPDPISVDFTFALGDEVFWQVEEQINGAAQGDPGNIVGPLWHFAALPEKALVTANPADLARFPYSDPDYEGDATFTCEFLSKLAPTTAAWFRQNGTEDPADDTAVTDADPDVTVTTIPAGEAYTSTLTIANIDIADEDNYYCRIVNAGGGVDSATAALGVKRILAHWSLDGNYLDITGSGRDAVPDLEPDPAQWVPGAAAATGQALDLVPQPLAAARVAPFAAAGYTDELTISMWVKWAGDTGDFQGLLCSRDNVSGVNNWFFEVNAAGNLQANAPGYNAFNTAMPAVGEWAHVVLTATAGEIGALYINGLQAAGSNSYSIGQDALPLYLGATGAPDDVISNAFNGAIDDIQLYNYAWDMIDVALEYGNVTGLSTCIGPVENDLNDDCRVDLLDLSILLGQWLDCQLYPDCVSLP